MYHLGMPMTHKSKKISIWKTQCKTARLQRISFIINVGSYVIFRYKKYLSTKGIEATPPAHSPPKARGFQIPAWSNLRDSCHAELCSSGLLARKFCKFVLRLNSAMQPNHITALFWMLALGNASGWRCLVFFGSCRVCTRKTFWHNWHLLFNLLKGYGNKIPLIGLRYAHVLKGLRLIFITWTKYTAWNNFLSSQDDLSRSKMRMQKECNKIASEKQLTVWHCYAGVKDMSSWQSRSTI